MCLPSQIAQRLAGMEPPDYRGQQWSETNNLYRQLGFR
jgi:hypothetical protein